MELHKHAARFWVTCSVAVKCGKTPKEIRASEGDDEINVESPSRRDRARLRSDRCWDSRTGWKNTAATSQITTNVCCCNVSYDFTAGTRKKTCNFLCFKLVFWCSTIKIIWSFYFYILILVYSVLHFTYRLWFVFPVFYCSYVYSLVGVSPFGLL